MQGIITIIIFFLFFIYVSRFIKRILSGGADKTGTQNKNSTNTSNSAIDSFKQILQAISDANTTTTTSSTSNSPKRTYQQIVQDIENEKRLKKDMQRQSMQTVKTTVSNRQPIFIEKEPPIQQNEVSSIEYQDVKKLSSSAEQLLNERKTVFIKIQGDEYEPIELDIRSALLGSIIFDRRYS